MKQILLNLSLVSTLFMSSAAQSPNVILIMADDMGYECLTANGAMEYQTPNLDRLAQTGMRFTNVYSQPLCTPSRVKIMTGKHNFRNYEYFGYLNPNQKTIGNLMKEAGYRTCISGKWQLNGLSYELPGHEDVKRPYHFGFDEYCLWQLNRPRKDGERYADPLIYQNGARLENVQDRYGPDIFVEFICDFMEKNAEAPFFIYYPMVLVHDPFVPTPDSPEWKNLETRGEKDNRYFIDMVNYTDKIIGIIESKLKQLELEDNTILIFTADNGTNTRIVSKTKDGPYLGGKSLTTQRGIHVPFVISWPGQLENGSDYDGLVDFSDFYPTLAELTASDISNEIIDGQSFYAVLKGDLNQKKSTILMHYDPEWGKTSRHRNRFVMNDSLKMYQSGSMFRFRSDIDEKNMVPVSEVDPNLTKSFKEMLELVDKDFPWKEKTTNP